MNKKIKNLMFILLSIITLLIVVFINIFTNRAEPIEEIASQKSNLSNNSLRLTEKTKLRVLVVEYNPKLKTQGNIKASEYLGRKNDERTIISEVLSDLEYCSHGYIETEIVDWIDVDEFAPLLYQITLKNGTKSNHIDEESWLEMMKDGYYNRNNQPITQQIGGFNFNYDEMLQRENLVQRRKNNEFDWVFIDLIDPAEAYESVMVGSNTYWINGNSNRTADCQNFPIIYANIMRKDGILHSIGHMAENVMNNVFSTFTSQYKYYDEKAINITSQEQYDNLNLWQKYVLSNYNSNTTFNGKEHYGPGTVHCPPNATYGYDYSGNSIVYSNWRDWQDNYPNLTGQVEATSSTAWLNQHTPSGDDSDDRRFMRWWFKLMPYYDGRNEDGYYHNWWKYITTLDFVKRVTWLVDGISLSVGENEDINVCKIEYQSGKEEIIKMSQLIASDEQILNISKTGEIVGIKEGSTNVDLIIDGIDVGKVATVTQNDKMPPEVTINYSSTNPTKENVVVTIIANEEIQPVTGWTLSSNKKQLTKIYTANTSEDGERVVIKDLVGNTTVKLIRIENIDKTNPELSAKYSTTELTNQSVRVTINSNEELKELNNWELSSNKKSLVRDYEINTSSSGERIVVSDLAGNQATININITNIDKTPPSLQIIYSGADEVAITNSVIVKMISNERLQEIDGWSLSNDKKELTKTYTANTTSSGEEIIVKDLAGNITRQIVTISDIGTSGDNNYSQITPDVPINGTTGENGGNTGNQDVTPPELSVAYSIAELTNQNVIVTISSNEELQEINGWTLSNDKKELTKTYVTNTPILGDNVTVKDLAGNESSTIIRVLNIDKELPSVNVNYSTTELTNQDVTVTITSNEELQQLFDWNLSEDRKSLTKIYDSNTDLSGETVIVKDLVGNEIRKVIVITNIDRKAPILLLNDNRNSEENEITVTIVSDEAVQEIQGWTLSQDEKILTRIYAKNDLVTDEIVIVKDLAGNEKKVVIEKINTEVEMLAITVNYSTTDITSDKVIVTINANNRLKELNGWTLSSNKKQLTKTYNENTTPEGEKYIVKDINDNEAEMTIIVNNIQHVMLSDINDNGKIDIGDILLLQRHIAQNNSESIYAKHEDWKLTEEKIMMGDINKNSKIDIGDILVLQRYMAAKNSDAVAERHREWLKVFDE